MFLERVGITNSFNDDNEYRFTPFFVSISILRIKINYPNNIINVIIFNNYFKGSKWHIICTHQEKRVIFCCIVLEKKFKSIPCSGALRKHS
jgi:hypothetical protein